MEIITYSGIVVICLAVGAFVKRSPQIADKWIPVIVGVLGGLLGAAAYLVSFPGFPADDIISAIVCGIASGLASTGVHQVGKQLTPGPIDADLDYKEGYNAVLDENEYLTSIIARLEAQLQPPIADIKPVEPEPEAEDE